MADVAATILASHGAHDGESYDLTGPRTLSLHDVAEEFALVTGRSVTYVDETVAEAWASRRSSGAPEWQVEAWVTTYLQLAHGELDVVSDAVPRIAGHPAVSLADFLATTQMARGPATHPRP